LSRWGANEKIKMAALNGAAQNLHVDLFIHNR
jgi:hypothetical protein